MVNVSLSPPSLPPPIHMWPIVLKESEKQKKGIWLFNSNFRCQWESRRWEGGDISSKLSSQTAANLSWSESSTDGWSQNNWKIIVIYKKNLLIHFSRGVTNFVANKFGWWTCHYCQLQISSPGHHLTWAVAEQLGHYWTAWWPLYPSCSGRNSSPSAS